MELNQKIDYKILKKQKNKIKKKYKKAIKKCDYDLIQKCLIFIKNYDDFVKTQKYEKYFNMMGAKMKEIIRLREEISYLKDFDTSIYEVFEEKLTKKMTDHINNYTERRLVQMKKQLISVKKQKINITRTKAIFRKKNGVL